MVRGTVEDPQVAGAVGEAMEALASLGYQQAEIMHVLAKIRDYDVLPAEEIIRQALKLFSGRQ